jgi:ABC-type transport system substrate-binding protein
MKNLNTLTQAIQSFRITAMSLSHREREFEMDQRKNNTWVRGLITLVICSLFIGQFSLASAKEYDGIWFLGFNLNRPPFNQLAVRQAVAHSLDKEYIAREIMGEEIVPGSPIPPGVEGHDSSLAAYKLNVKYAKKLIAQSGYKSSDPILKSVILLHTDGDKTIEIAQLIREELKKIGLKVELEQVRYRDEEKWNSALAGGKFSLFLMGYKSDNGDLFTQEAHSDRTDGSKILSPLFSPGGEANFTGFNNAAFNELMQRLSLLNPALSKERGKKLIEAGRLVYRSLPIVPLFYIEKI